MNSSNQLNQPSSDRTIQISMSDEELNEALNVQLNLVTPDMQLNGVSQLPLNVAQPLVDLTDKEDEESHNDHINKRRTKGDMEDMSGTVPKESDVEMNENDNENTNFLGDIMKNKRSKSPDDSITQALQDDSIPNQQTTGNKKQSDFSTVTSTGNGGNKTTQSATNNAKSNNKNNNKKSSNKGLPGEDIMTNTTASATTTVTVSTITTNNNTSDTRPSETSVEKTTTQTTIHNNENDKTSNKNSGDDENASGSFAPTTDTQGLADITTQSQVSNTISGTHSTGTNNPMEIFQPGLPRKYEVLVQARVREKKDLDSSHITDLPEGTTVTVAEIDGRRARIITPIHGWLSIKSKFGAKILLPLDGNHSKVGHQVYITDQQSNVRYAGKIVDYNETDCKHLVRLNDGQELLVDIKAPNIKVVKDTEHMREARNRLSGDAPAFDPKASKQSNSLYLFHKLLWRDHPDFVKEEHARVQAKQEQRWMLAHQQNAEMAAHNAQRGGHPMHLQYNAEGTPNYPVSTSGYPSMARGPPLLQPQSINGTGAPIEHTVGYNPTSDDVDNRRGDQEPGSTIDPNYYNQQMRTGSNMRTDKTAKVPPPTTDAQKPKGEKKKARGLIVLRGLPGSGKTTLAKKLAARHGNAQICTEDKYHWSSKEDGIGEYRFRPELVFLAREWCTKEIRACIKKRVELIILDNHNARISMYEDHIQYAVKHGYRFRIIEFIATEELIDQYRNRSYKKFPREVFVKLLKLWEKDSRAELVNPAFDDGSGESHNYNATVHPSNNTENPGNHKEKEKEKVDNNANDKEHNADSQKESKKSKGMLRTSGDVNGNEGNIVDPNLRNNNNTGESAQWETEQPQYPLNYR